MAAYFARRYGPGNTTLAATGKVDFSKVVELAEKYCGSWKPAAAPRKQGKAKYQRHKKILTDGKLNRQYTMGMTPGPSAQDERRFAARVLADVVGDSDGSRFYWALVDDAIAEDADFGFYPHDGCGSFYISLVSDPKRAGQALEIARKELKRVRGDLSEAEVERAKNKLSSAIVLDGEVPLGRMRSIASNWIYNREYRSLEKDMATLESVTAESMRKLMEDFPFEPMTIVSLGPKRSL
jgi:predicted Zn-dependent peptidase